MERDLEENIRQTLTEFVRRRAIYENKSMSEVIQEEVEEFLEEGDEET